jgi:hypothetical protein
MLLGALSLCLMGIIAFADGGSSVAGPGAPQIEWVCGGMNDLHFGNYNEPHFSVLVGRFWPDYNLKMLIFDTYANEFRKHEVQRQDPVAEGAPLIFDGESDRLFIETAAEPIHEDGAIYLPAKLLTNTTTVHELKCKYSDPLKE